MGFAAGRRIAEIRPAAAGAANRNKTNTICFILGLIFSAPARFFRPSEQKIDSALYIGILILLKTQFGHVPEA